MHVHQQQSKTYRMEEPPALEEVKHPHRDRTSVSRSPSTEQEVLSQFSGFSKEIEHSTRDPYTTHLKSCTQSTDYAFKGQEVHTYIDCEHSHGHMNDHLIQNTSDFQGKQLLQGKEKITCTDMENTPGMMNTFTSGSTTPSQHSMVSIHTHSGIVPQNSQQLEKESSNTVALPGFKHSADTTTHTEASRNVHSNGALSTSLQTDTNRYANMDTNHTAHRYRDTRKEVHLLSGPPELRPLEAMAHRNTRKEAHLLSRPSELQPTEDSETQRCNPAHFQQTRQEYSRLTEINKAKFQNPFIYNDERNFVRHNSVSKISSNNVFMTTPNTSVSNSVFCRKKGRKRGICRDSRNSRRTCTCTYSRRTCTCTCTCSHTGDSP